MNRPVRVHHVLFMFVLCEARFLEKIPIRAFRVPRRISITREERAENVSHHCTGDRHTGAAGVSDWCTAAAIGRPVARSHFRMNEQVGRLLFPAVRIGARRFISAGGGALEPFERRKVAAPGHILQANLP